VQLPLDLHQGAERRSSGRPPPTPRVTQRILVVDDNVDGAELLARALNAMGHVTRIAHDGLEALDATREFSPEVILLDIGLPIIDGYEVARQLRQMKLNQRPTLIAVTGYGQESDYKRSLGEGFAHHLVKPIEAAQLEGALASIARPAGDDSRA
jgi:CheY-like chemotaxis protein